MTTRENCKRLAIPAPRGRSLWLGFVPGMGAGIVLAAVALAGLGCRKSSDSGSESTIETVRILAQPHLDQLLVELELPPVGDDFLESLEKSRESQLAGLLQSAREPDHWDYGRLGIFFHHHGYSHIASASYHKALLLSPGLPDTYLWNHLLGHQEELASTFDQAEAQFCEAVRKNPRSVSSRLRLAELALRSGRQELIDWCLEDCEELTPNRAQTRRLAALKQSKPTHSQDDNKIDDSPVKNDLAQESRE